MLLTRSRTLGGCGNRIRRRRVYLAGMCSAFRLALFPVARPAPAKEAPLAERHSSAVPSRTWVDELPLLAFHGHRDYPRRALAAR